MLHLSTAQGKVEMKIDNTSGRVDVAAIKLLKFILLDEWRLPRSQVAALLNIDLNTLDALLSDDKSAILEEEQLLLISALIKIYKALRTIFPEQDQANGWVYRPNQYFSGHSALEFMMQHPTDNVLAVMHYTQGQL